MIRPRYGSNPGYLNPGIGVWMWTCSPASVTVCVTVGGIIGFKHYWAVGVSVICNRIKEEEEFFPVGWISRLLRSFSHHFDEINNPLHPSCPRCNSLCPKKIRILQEHYSNCLSLSASIEMKWILLHWGSLQRSGWYFPLPHFSELCYLAAIPHSLLFCICAFHTSTHIILISAAKDSTFYS